MREYDFMLSRLLLAESRKSNDLLREALASLVRARISAGDSDAKIAGQCGLGLSELMDLLKPCSPKETAA